MRIIFTLFGIISIFYQFPQVLTQTTIDFFGFGIQEGCGGGCEKGYKSEAGGCEPCPIGQYQDEMSQTACKSCPPGKTTLKTAGTSNTLCIDECGPGKEYIIKSKTCEVCPIGFYKNATMPTCFKCPDGQTTTNAGSDSCVTSFVTESPDTPRRTFTMVTEFSIVGGCDANTNTGQIIGLIQLILREGIQAQGKLYPGVCSNMDCANAVTTVQLSCTDVNPPPRAQATTAVSNVPVEVSLNSAATRLTERVLEEALYDRTMFEESLNDNDLRFVGIQSITKTQTCQDGQQYLQNNTCVDCPVGTYARFGKCMECSGVKTTASTGSKSESDCVSPCSLNTGYCLNGGTCKDGAEIVCQCPDAYEGATCQSSKASNDYNKGFGAGIGVGLGIAVALAVTILVAVVIYRYRTGKRQKQENSYARADVSTRVDDTQDYQELNVYTVPDTDNVK